MSVRLIGVLRQILTYFCDVISLLAFIVSSNIIS